MQYLLVASLGLEADLTRHVTSAEAENLTLFGAQNEYRKDEIKGNDWNGDGERWVYGMVECRTCGWANPHLYFARAWARAEDERVTLIWMKEEEKTEAGESQ